MQHLRTKVTMWMLLALAPHPTEDGAQHENSQWRCPQMLAPQIQRGHHSSNVHRAWGPSALFTRLLESCRITPAKGRKSPKLTHLDFPPIYRSFKPGLPWFRKITKSDIFLPLEGCEMIQTCFNIFWWNKSPVTIWLRIILFPWLERPPRGQSSRGVLFSVHWEWQLPSCECVERAEED